MCARAPTHTIIDTIIDEKKTIEVEKLETVNNNTKGWSLPMAFETCWAEIKTPSWKELRKFNTYFNISTHTVYSYVQLAIYINVNCGICSKSRDSGIESDNKLSCFRYITIINVYLSFQYIFTS